VGIVEVALVLIAENLVGSAGLFELDLGLFTLVFGDLVRVESQGGLLNC
jgi:hypothetical protein